MTVAWILRRTRRGISRHRAGLFALMLSFTALATLAGVGWLGRRAHAAWAPLVQRNVHVIAYLRDDVSAARAQALAELLRRLPGVETVGAIDSATAMRRLRSQTGSLSGSESLDSLLAGVEDGFLPASLEIGLAPTPGLALRIRDIDEHLRRLPDVVETDAMLDGVSRLTSWLELVTWISVAALVLAGGGAFSALCWSLGRARVRRREEAAVLSFLGDTGPGIRLPARVAASASALLGVGAGLATAALLFRTLSASLPGAIAAVAATAPPAFRLVEVVAALGVALLAGAVVGGIATPLPRDGHAGG